MQVAGLSTPGETGAGIAAKVQPMHSLASSIRVPGWLPATLLGSVLLAAPALAEPLTCSAFKDRLKGALVVAANPNTEVPAYKETRATDGGGSHANWETSALSGSLTCGGDDRFQEFYVSLDVTTRDKFVEQLKGLVALDGAAICTLATAGPTACTDTGKVLLQDALEKMGTGFKRRVTNPNGLSNRMLWPDIKAELTAAPSLITFSLAAAEGATPDAERRALPAPALPAKTPPPAP